MPEQPKATPGRQIPTRCYQPRLSRSVLDVATSIVPYLALSALLDLTLGVSVLLTVSLVVLAAGFLVRTFVVFHDCAHGSLFGSKRANRWVGRLAGLLVLSPFERWRHDHAVHHGTSGDLERRGVGDIVTLTVREYRARSWRGRLAYRATRNPLVMFGLGPIVAMVIGPRIATRAQRPRLRHSVLATDAVVFLLAAGMCWLIGWERLLLVWAPAGAARRIGWDLAVLCSTPVRGRLLAERRRLGLHRGGAPRQLLPEAAQAARVLHRPYRVSPRASSQRADPELQPPARSPRELDLPSGADAVAAGRASRSPPQALGRGPREAGLVRAGSPTEDWAPSGNRPIANREG